MWKFLALVLTLCCGTMVSAQSVESCYENMTSCLPEFRNRYLDENLFWFGTSYGDLCPGGHFCFNVRPDLQSVMSRLLVTNDTATLQAAVSGIQVLNVTFQRPALSYHACDSTFEFQARSPYQIPPLGPSLLSQAITNHARPHVAWEPRTPETLYTVVMWDASFFLHALYVNCPNGTWENGQAVQPWTGTAVAYLLNSAYAFLVYEQTQMIPLEIAQRAMQETSEAGGPGPVTVFDMTLLLQKVSTYVDPAIQYSVIMEMRPDPFGAFRITNFFGVNNICPLFYSQLPAFHSAVHGMQIPSPQWSGPAHSFSQLSRLSQLLSLTVDIRVTYETDDYTDTACCREFSITRGSYVVAPLDSRPVRAAMARHAPRVFLTPIFLSEGRSSIAGTPYTLLMVDATPALAPTAGGPRLITHWLVTNIFGSDFTTGTEVVPYFGPNPPNESQPHAYMFLLFEQSNIVDPATLARYCPNGFLRCQLRVTDIIQTWDLGEIVGVNWFEAKTDDFATKRRYTVFGEPEAEVCRGREGFATPCPTAPATCSAIGQLQFSSHLLTGVLVVLSLMLNNYRVSCV